MKQIKTYSILLLFFFNHFLISAQSIVPGFSKREYKELLCLTAHNSNPPYSKDIPFPTQYQRVYASKSIALDNCWELWTNNANQLVISIRSSTAKQESWLENFYAAMIPAKGTLQLSANESFEYNLADDPKASVHTGWTIGMAFIAKEVFPKLDSAYLAGTRDLYIVGHSQGGAISYLLTAYLLQKQINEGVYPELKIKTYCSAAPKPGNLYFAYDYEKMTQAGYSFTVVNREDWVPEMPFSTQTVRDFATVNPFTNVRPLFKTLSFGKRIAFKYLYGQLSKPPLKAVKRYNKYLGKMCGKFVVKTLKESQTPSYVQNFNYVRTGAMIILSPDQEYYERFPLKQENFLGQHSFQAYLYLIDRF